LYPVDESRLDEDVAEIEPSSEEIKTKTE